MEKNTSDFGEIYFDLIDEQIIRLDSKFRIIKTNQSAKDFFSKKGISEFEGLTCQELCIFRDVEGNHVCPAVESKKTKKIHSEELKTDDGETWLVKVYPILNNSDEIDGFFEVSFEITEQKKMQSELKENSEILNSIIQYSPRGFVAFKGRNNVVITNPALEEMLGYSHEELKEKTLLGITHPEDFDMSKAVSDKALEEQKHAIFEKRYITKDGRIIPARVVTWGTYDEEGDWVYNFGSIEDISTRIETEKAIRESERYSNSILNNTFQLLGLITPDGETIKINKRGISFEGVKEEDIIGRCIWDYPSIQRNPGIKQILKKAVKLASKGELYNTEFFLDDLRGNRRRMSFTINPILDDNSKVIHLLAEGLDITERFEAQEELKRSEEKFRTIFEQAREGFLLRELDGSVIVANQGLFDIFGYSRFDAKGRNIREFTPYISEEVLEERTNETLEEGYNFYEVEARRSDGTIFPLEVQSSLNKMGEEEKVFSVFRDISERKESEEALRKSENRFRTIFEHSIDALWLRKKDGTIVDVNPSFEKMTGYQIEELDGETIFLLLDRNESELEPYFERLLKDGQHQEEIEVIRKDGSLVPVEISSTLIELEGETVVFGVGRDISEKKEAEELRREAYSQIENNINNFEILVDRIRNPLAVIIGSAELNDMSLNETIIKNAKEIADITQLMTTSWLESVKFRQILQAQLLQD